MTLSSVIPRLFSLFSSYGVVVPGAEYARDAYGYESDCMTVLPGSASHADRVRTCMKTMQGKSFLDYLRRCIKKRLSHYVHYMYPLDDDTFWNSHMRCAVCAMILDPRYRDSAVPFESTSKSLRHVFMFEWKQDSRLSGTAHCDSVMSPQVSQTTNVS